MTNVRAGRFPFGRVSLYGKCLGLVAVITVLVAGLITINAATLLRDVATIGLRDLAYDSTEALAHQVSGAIKFGKQPVVDSAFTTFATRAGGRLQGGRAFDLQLGLIGQFGMLPDADRKPITDLALRALTSGKVETDDSGLLVAAPAVFGEKAAVTGVVVLQWTTAQLEARYGTEQTRAYLSAARLFAVLLAIAARVLHRALRLPMHQIAGAMTMVANAVDAMREIAKVSGQISTIVGVIFDISFQTNSLITGSASQVTQCHVAMVQAASTTSEALAREATHPVRLVSVFSVDDAAVKTPRVRHA